MPTEIKIPSFGESIKVVYLAEWKKITGDYVEAGEIICEIETDKASQELPSEVAGILTTQVSEEDEIPVGAVIATVDESAPRSAEAASAKPETTEHKTEHAPVDGAEAPVPKPVPSPVPQAEPVLSPAAQYHAAKENINPAAIEGTGRGGRILKEDVLAAAKPAEDAPVVAPTPAPAPVPQTFEPTDGQPDTTRKRMSMMRRTIANRLVSVQHEAAILTTFNEADMSQIIRLRKTHQEAFVKKHDVKIGFMSFFVRAVVRALKTVPSLNAQIDGTDIVQHHRFHIGVAISTERGLMVPVLRNADQMTLAQIEQAIIAHANNARAGQISLSDLEGGGFSITNGGIFGSMLSTPILNPPQSGILGMHSIQQRPVAMDGQVVIRPMMYLALSYDHRIVDGREAVTFLINVKQYIEHPAVELLDL